MHAGINELCAGLVASLFAPCSACCLGSLKKGPAVPFLVVKQSFIQ